MCFLLLVRQLTFFVIAAVVAWAVTVILVAINAVIAAALTNNPTSAYITAIFRDISLVVLAVLLLLPRIPSRSAATKISSQGRDDKLPEKSMVAARTHSTLGEQDREREMEEV